MWEITKNVEKISSNFIWSSPFGKREKRYFEWNPICLIEPNLLLVNGEINLFFKSINKFTEKFERKFLSFKYVSFAFGIFKDWFMKQTV